MEDCVPHHNHSFHTVSILFLFHGYTNRFMLSAEGISWSRLVILQITEMVKR